MGEEGGKGDNIRRRESKRNLAHKEKSLGKRPEDSDSGYEEKEELDGVRKHEFLCIPNAPAAA